MTRVANLQQALKTTRLALEKQRFEIKVFKPPYMYQYEIDAELEHMQGQLKILIRRHNRIHSLIDKAKELELAKQFREDLEKLMNS